MRKTLLTTLMLLAAWTAAAQVTIPGTKVSFDFPNGGWKYLQTTKIDANTSLYLYSYAAQNLVDANGDTTVPCLRVYVRTGYKQSVYDFAYERYVQQPFQSVYEYTDGLPKDALGYIGLYTDAVEKRDYEIRMVLLRQGNNAVEFRLETTRDTYEQMAAEFEAVAATLKTGK